jgi:hypothetical protein
VLSAACHAVNHRTSRRLLSSKAVRIEAAVTARRIKAIIGQA